MFRRLSWEMSIKWHDALSQVRPNKLWLLLFIEMCSSLLQPYRLPTLSSADAFAKSKCTVLLSSKFAVSDLFSFPAVFFDVANIRRAVFAARARLCRYYYLSLFSFQIAFGSFPFASHRLSPRIVLQLSRRHSIDSVAIYCANWKNAYRNRENSFKLQSKWI